MCRYKESHPLVKKHLVYSQAPILLGSTGIAEDRGVDPPGVTPYPCFQDKLLGR